jgi:hypothetical protein
MRFQIRTRDDGRHEVIDMHTGQVRFSGSAYGAQSVQAQLQAADSRARPR